MVAFVLVLLTEVRPVTSRLVVEKLVLKKLVAVAFCKEVGRSSILEEGIINRN